MLSPKNRTESELFGPIGLQFDLIKEFYSYFPKNNYTNVIKCYKKVQTKVASN